MATPREKQEAIETLPKVQMIDPLYNPNPPAQHVESFFASILCGSCERAHPGWDEDQFDGSNSHKRSGDPATGDIRQTCWTNFQRDVTFPALVLFPEPKR